MLSASNAMEPIVNGRHLVQFLTVETVAAARTGGRSLLRAEGTDEDRRLASRQFDELFDSMPRELQIGIESLSPMNMAITVFGGALAPVLINSGSRSAFIIGKLIEPWSRGVTGFAREALAETGLRSAFERTEGAPMPVRAASALLVAGLAARPDDAASALVRAQMAADVPSAIARQAPGALEFGRRPGEDLIRRTTVVLPEEMGGRGLAGGAEGTIPSRGPMTPEQAQRFAEMQRTREAFAAHQPRPESIRETAGQIRGTSEINNEIMRAEAFGIGAPDELRALGAAELDRRAEAVLGEVAGKFRPEVRAAFETFREEIAESLARARNVASRGAADVGPDELPFVNFLETRLKALDEIAERVLPRVPEPPPLPRVAGGAPGTIPPEGPLFPEMHVPDWADNLAHGRPPDPPPRGVRRAEEPAAALRLFVDSVTEERNVFVRGIEAMREELAAAEELASSVRRAVRGGEQARAAVDPFGRLSTGELRAWSEEAEATAEAIRTQLQQAEEDFLRFTKRTVEQRRPVGERVQTTVLRLYEGALNTARSRAQTFVAHGNRQLEELGIGVARAGSRMVHPTDELRQLFRALHNPRAVRRGEIRVPERLRQVFDELRNLTDWEQAASIDFDPNMATAEDYFYRGWKPPSGLIEGRGGPVGGRPGFRRVRRGATFDEMLDAGFEPLFWNPYEQWRHRHNLGVSFREQTVLLERLKAFDLAVPATDDVLPAGMRVPKVGPAFEGKAFAVPGPDGPVIARTHRYAVDNDLANRLEQLFGRPFDAFMETVRVAGHDIRIADAIDKATFGPKRAKLLASFFQDIDFLSRLGAGGWSALVDDLLSGKPLSAIKRPLQFPRQAERVIRARLSSDFREEMRLLRDSTEPLIEGRPGIHFRGISEAGWSTIDPTILPADIDAAVRTLTGDLTDASLPRRVLDRITEFEGGLRRGLFDGVYPVAQMEDIRNFIAPAVVKRFGHLNDEQVNALIAAFANIKYSTVPTWQTVLSNPMMSYLSRRLLFSFGENEALLRQATQAVRGPNKETWRLHWAGTYLWFAAVANLIHFSSTGEPLPLERYSPISRTHLGPLPIGYNRDFMAPNVPFTGRSGAELTVDIVGQMDTVFRVLDPMSFLNARTSVPVSAARTQVSGRDFFGEPVDRHGPGGIFSRTLQAVDDLFIPIGPGNLAEVARQLRPEIAAILPAGEDRLGVWGSLAQMSGVNFRAATTRQMLDARVDELVANPPPWLLNEEQRGGPLRTWNDLEPFERNLAILTDQELDRELKLRRDTALVRGDEAALLSEEADAARERLIRQQVSADRQLLAGEITNRDWRLQNRARNDEIRIRFSQLFGDEEIADPQHPVHELHNVIIQNTDATGAVDWEAVDEWRAHLTARENDFIDRNTGLNDTQVSRLMRDWRRELASGGWWDAEDTVFRRFQQQHEQLADFRSFREFLSDVRVRVVQASPSTPPELLDDRRNLAVFAGVLQGADGRDMTQMLIETITDAVNQERHVLIADSPRLAALAIVTGYEDIDGIPAVLRPLVMPEVASLSETLRSTPAAPMGDIYLEPDAPSTPPAKQAVAPQQSASPQGADEAEAATEEEEIAEAFLGGESVEEIARRLNRSEDEVRAIINR